ncbi:serine/threonine-protein kinase [Massilia sp. S19_KUP03_FR1]|uniref:serine/threonine-protein kinase n=1 Tax=Massilia sp. S19_KUP03_FR1 TaxID=3025503 RepID=UPI002FCD72A9
MIRNLGKYRIDSVLGKGAMGVVYKAFDPWIERVVALKTIRKELFADGQQQELINRFKNEAQAAGRLQHPNIVMVFDYGEDAESAYIAMEFVDGTPLDALLQPGQPSAPARVAAWMGDLLQGLEYAHARGVVHRDIKPANLLITSGAQLKISDFGIARIESSTLTQAGALVGTPSYMSPEQFRAEPVDGRADIFSAGIVLYQLLTGARPFAGTAATVMQQIMNEQPAAPSHVLPVLGTRFDRVVATAMAKAPAQRYASARAFHAALQEALDGNPDPDATALVDSERTMLGAGLPAPAPLARALDTGSATLTPWKLEAFPDVEAILARQIGPMARFLLKKVAARADGLDQLGELLLPHIPSEVGRVQFQQALAGVKNKLLASGTGAGIAAPATLSGAMRTPLPTERAGSTAPTLFDTAWADATTVKLIALIGPIGRIVAKRAMKETGDRAAFLALLAGHIDNLDQRARFLADAGDPS